MNWYNETMQGADSEALKMFYPKFLDRYKEALKTVSGQPHYKDDFANKSINDLFLPQTRVYLQMSNFNGDFESTRLQQRIKKLANIRYNLTNDDLIVYSSVNTILEQISVLPGEFLSIYILIIESCFAFSLLFLFDLRVVFVLILIISSFFVSLLSSFVAFGFSFNMLNLLQFIILPALIPEFLFYTPYLLLYKTKYKTNRRSLEAVKNRTDSIFLNVDPNDDTENKSFINQLK
jgi:hypothetical protein